MLQALMLPLLLLLAHVKFLSVISPASLLVIIKVRLVLLLFTYVSALVLHCKEVGGALAVIHMYSILSRDTACICTMYGILGPFVNRIVSLVHLALHVPAWINVGSFAKRLICSKSKIACQCCSSWWYTSITFKLCQLQFAVCCVYAGVSGWLAGWLADWLCTWIADCMGSGCIGGCCATFGFGFAYLVVVHSSMFIVVEFKSL